MWPWRKRDIERQRLIPEDQELRSVVRKLAAAPEQVRKNAAAAVATHNLLLVYAKALSIGIPAHEIHKLVATFNNHLLTTCEGHSREISALVRRVAYGDPGVPGWAEEFMGRGAPGEDRCDSPE